MAVALLDANLIVLLAVGLTDPEAITLHKRTAAFVPEDLQALVDFLERFDSLSSTPHALAEASNLLTQCSQPLRSEVLTKLGELVESVIEVYVPSARAAAAQCFERLGLTDASLAEAARDGRVLVTADLDLYVWLSSMRLEAYNFNHVRLGAWS